MFSDQIFPKLVSASVDHFLKKFKQFFA